MATTGAKDESVLDPAEYLFHKTKFHDCHLTVRDPATGQVEVFGVVTSHLVAHSTVFRDMLIDSELADPTGTNTHITDVTPEIFKLMLRHVYGGTLPDMSQETVVELAFCADKYNIQSLLCRVSTLLTPETVHQVFPALRCVVYIQLPDLKKQVTNIVQEQTDELVKSKEFLDIDENCLEFITKQEKLAITEVELWRSVIKWAIKQTDGKSDLRQHLNKHLQHIRLLTFTKDEILEEIMPSKVLCPAETIDLLSAVTKNQSLAVSGLCTIRNKREYAGKDCYKSTFTSLNCNNLPLGAVKRFEELPDYKTSSYFSITALTDLKLDTFTFKSGKLPKVENPPVYGFECNVTMFTYVNGLSTGKVTQYVQVRDRAMYDEDITIPLKLSNGQFFCLKARSSYAFLVQFTIPHPVYRTVHKLGRLTTDYTCTRKTNEQMVVKFKTPLHVQCIGYSYFKN